MNDLDTITKDTVIGDIIKRYPKAVEIIEKYFGQGCFTCPGISMESIGFGATMHGCDPEAIVNDLNLSIRKNIVTI